jgi:hypothetical protein
MNGLAPFQSIKIVHAGEITEVKPEGCFVRHQDGTPLFHAFAPNMTTRYQPVIGDFWVVYDDGYESISPAWAFQAGYVSTAKAQDVSRDIRTTDAPDLSDAGL